MRWGVGECGSLLCNLWEMGFHGVWFVGKLCSVEVFGRVAVLFILHICNGVFDRVFRIFKDDL